MEKLRRKNLILKIALIIYILFLASFSLDSLSTRETFIELIPVTILSLGLIFSWKKPELTGIFCILVGIAFTIFFNSYKRVDLFMIISFPVILIGVLLLTFNSKKK